MSIFNGRKTHSRILGSALIGTTNGALIWCRYWWVQTFLTCPVHHCQWSARRDRRQHSLLGSLRGWPEWLVESWPRFIRHNPYPYMSYVLYGLFASNKTIPLYKAMNSQWMLWKEGVRGSRQGCSVPNTVGKGLSVLTFIKSIKKIGLSTDHT